VQASSPGNKTGKERRRITRWCTGKGLQKIMKMFSSASFVHHCAMSRHASVTHFCISLSWRLTDFKGRRCILSCRTISCFSKLNNWNHWLMSLASLACRVIKSLHSTELFTSQIFCSFRRR
jgi:hypothetical protein